jgi:hypothetical protein
LTNDFPWCEFNNPSIRELVTPLTALLNSVRVEKFHLRPSNGCTLQPDLTQNSVHLHPNTKAAWRTLISTCEHSWRTNDSAYYIKIATALNVPPHSFLRVVRNDETVGLVELILQNQLDDALIWARESLPRSGDYMFMPHASWSGHAPFPKGKIRGSKKREPRDERNMIWQWDMLHQNHWDVQTVKGVRQARVTPDGRELPLNE